MKKFEQLGRSLSKNEMKNVSGGFAEDPVGDVRVCGTRWYNGQCYCDWCDRATGLAFDCDKPCTSFFCGY
jgi:hypothetical protein